MKKIIPLALALSMLFNAAGNAAFARFDGLTWFESIDNMQKLKSYSVVQVISGDVAGQSDTESVGDPEQSRRGTGNFTFNVKSDIVNRGNLKTDSKNTVEGKLHFALTGKDRPFNDLDASFRFSVIALDKFGAYIRLENMDFNASGILKEDMQGYLDFKTEFAKAIDPVKWQWIHIPNKYLKGQLDQNVPMDLGSLDTKALKKDIAKKGFKKAIQKAIKGQIDTMVKDGQMEKEEGAKAESVIDRFFKAEFFKLKTVSNPGKEDSTTFALNSKKILDFIRESSLELDEAMTETDLADLQEALGKFSLSGLFHQNAEFGIFDRLKINLILKNVEELTRLQVSYGLKIGNINAIEALKPPAKSIKLDDANLGFLPPAAETTDSELNIEISPTDLEPVPTDEF